MDTYNDSRKSMEKKGIIPKSTKVPSFEYTLSLACPTLWGAVREIVKAPWIAYTKVIGYSLKKLTDTHALM
jgi:hypothetical protein